MTKRTSLRIPVALYTWLKARAERERRTISNLIVALLSAAQEKDDEQNKVDSN